MVRRIAAALAVPWAGAACLALVAALTLAGGAPAAPVAAGAVGAARGAAGNGPGLLSAPAAPVGATGPAPFGPSPAHWASGWHPHRRAPGSGAVREAQASTNWAGWIESGTTFTGVSGSWTVPAVSPSQSAQYSSEWVGIDGVSSLDLIQTGTSQETSGGTTSYGAWYEMLPAGAVAIGATVAPGDHMVASITESAPGTWTITIEDQTRSWVYDAPFAYAAQASTAEWIEEAPTVNGVQSTLADFGTAAFGSLDATGTNMAGTAMTQVVTTDAAGTIISYPSPISSNSFTDTYGTPPPTVTAVSPDSGGTAGGTSVTVEGDYLFGATAVTFGGSGASGQINGDGSLTVTAPPGSVGTVDVRVTTPGGTSAVGVGDRFTYGSPPPPVAHGYWLVGSDGGIFTFGSAQFYGSTGSLRLQRPVAGIVPTPDRNGYWLDASDGGVFAFGDAGYHGSLPGLGIHPAGTGLPDSLDAPIVGMVPSADGGGYFMVGADGGVFAFGDARFAGSCPGIGGCAGAAVAVMPDATGNGYWLVTRSGHVYTFGDAAYFGAPGPQNVPVTSAVRTPDGGGYWVLFADGAVASFGDAGAYGQPVGAFGGLDPATAIFATADGGGYWVASASGAVDNYGDAPWEGSMAGTTLNGSIIAATGW